ncbi:unnamed protein product [Rotaria magnacalcarata]|uniref:Uncharacterized protein n=1 Tax=Rotaria magnacalcarata TaxID=392030 RepID=A0A814XP97_9BILA|nr:unnamed protein product [Rotaria magnacalcarata]CAF1217927.1 unnamed protein product [Rotaria magnacalcarata]CAF2033256.1 unnamed protein product [Rotaria magnacalcarata]CAF2066830.1 unnamed protein product [Rotaria magnacalcarata]CAF2109933.1 unnamed protein product [Rotaria magnacalcarata]
MYRSILFLFLCFTTTKISNGNPDRIEQYNNRDRSKLIYSHSIKTFYDNEDIQKPTIRTMTMDGDDDDDQFNKIKTTTKTISDIFYRSTMREKDDHNNYDDYINDFERTTTVTKKNYFQKIKENKTNLFLNSSSQKKSINENKQSIILDV